MSKAFGCRVSEPHRNNKEKRNMSRTCQFHPGLVASKGCPPPSSAYQKPPYPGKHKSCEVEAIPKKDLENANEFVGLV